MGEINKQSISALLACLLRKIQGVLRVFPKRVVRADAPFRQSPESLNEEGRSSFSRGDFSTALACFDAALSIKPDYAEAYGNRGATLKTLGRFSEALASFDAALDVKPGNINSFFNKGLVLLQLQRPTEALDCFDAVLAIDPLFAEACNGRGVALKELERKEDALKCFDAALAIRPEWSEVYSNRAQLLQELNRLPEALESYDAGVRAGGDRGEVYIKRGRLLFGLRRYEDALSDFDTALAISPYSVEALGFKGLALQQLNKTEQALASYESAIALEPDCADAHFNRGVILLNLSRNDEALSCFDMALSLKENWAEAYYNRGVVLDRVMRKDEALSCFDRALSINPAFPDAHNSRGVVLNDLQRQEEALASYEAALAIAPEHAEALNNRGVVGSDLVGPKFALENFDAALAVKPDYADAIFNKSLMLIQAGNYQDGWALYEWRWMKEGVKAQFGFRDPSWLGQENICGKTLLIYPEQGFGDYIQFCRYALMIKEMGGRIVLEVPKPLLSVMKTLHESFVVVEKGAELPPFDFQCPVMSLPLALKTDVETIPARVPYLFADEKLINKRREKIGSKKSVRVGLVWSGSSTHKKDFARSIALALFDRVLSLPLEFHSLQKEIRPDDEAALSRFPQLLSHAEELTDFSDTAVLVAAMDLIISVDTSVAHLACAMGKPVWILLPYAPDYRWMLEREDSPWYPTATLIRQQKVGDWSYVLSDVERKLFSQYLHA